VPRFHYETRAFSKVVSNTDLTDNDLGRRHERQFFYEDAFFHFREKFLATIIILRQNKYSANIPQIAVSPFYHCGQIFFYFLNFISVMLILAEPLCRA
jgi:hypothetical protein